MDKKKLLLIGNGPIDVDISEKVSEFDYVLRINRMTNYATTKGKTDGLFIGAYHDYKYIYKGGEYKSHIKDIKDIYLTENLKNNFDNWGDFLTREQWENVKIMDFGSNMKNIGIPFPTTTICVLNVLTSKPEWYKNYDIWVCGITVNGRGKLMLNGKPWMKTNHRFEGDKEEEFLKKLLLENKIKRLIPDIDDNFHNS